MAFETYKCDRTRAIVIDEDRFKVQGPLYRSIIQSLQEVGGGLVPHSSPVKKVLVSILAKVLAFISTVCGEIPSVQREKHDGHPVPSTRY